MEKLVRMWQRIARKAWNAPLKNKLLVAGGVLLIFLAVTPVLTYTWFAREISDRSRLMNHSNTGLAIFDKDGEQIYAFGRTSEPETVPLSAISDDLEQAVLASEDQGFYSHPGFSIKGIAAALYANLLNKNATAYGGSTITQQLVKNNLLSSEKNVLRKYQELSLAIAIERRYTKQEIMEMYLNSVYFGEGAFGIKSAAKTYFNKEPSQLTAAESSYLVGILPAPSIYSPYGGDMQKAARQQERVLRLMQAEGYLSDEERKAAAQAKLAFSPQNIARRQNAEHFTQMVIQQLNERYGEERVSRSGYRVTTSLNLDWQQKAESIVAANMRTIRNYKGSNASMIAIDPKSGEVRALVGSYDWDDTEFGKINMTLSPRQPGSSFKPIYYTEALERKLITPATIMKDAPKTYANGYRPQNYDFRWRGDITVRNALATSLNIPALDVMEKLEVSEAAATARRMGISDVTEPEKYGLTLALGTAEVKLAEMANAYAAFANQGNQYDMSLIVSIKDKFGKTIYTNKPKAKRVQSAQASYLISNILSDNAARAPTFGSLLNIPGRKAAVKTGTTDDNRDAWTIGYTPSLAIAAWVGNNDNQPMGVGGSDLAGPIWRSSMTQFLAGTPAEEFSRPDGIQEMRVCVLGRVYQEVFIQGTAPSGGACRLPEKKPEKNEKKEEKEEKQQEKREETESRPEGGRGSNEQQTPPEGETEPAPPPDGGGNGGHQTEPAPPPAGQGQTEPVPAQ